MWLTVGMFGGLRPEEAKRLQWLYRFQAEHETYRFAGQRGQRPKAQNHPNGTEFD
jgi:hypothetical protein